MSQNMKIRRVKVTECSQIPANAAETPGGTMFDFTPGGTKIIYDRDYLLHLKNSPASKKTPNLPNIPGVTTPANPVSSLATVSSSGIEQAEDDMPDIPEEDNSVGDDMEL